jgi:hypothetical protein
MPPSISLTEILAAATTIITTLCGVIVFQEKEKSKLYETQLASSKEREDRVLSQILAALQTGVSNIELTYKSVEGLVANQKELLAYVTERRLLERLGKKTDA